MTKKTFVLSLFSLILPCLVFFYSCSDSAPKITSVNPCVVFEFDDEQSSPKVRLSIFASSESDIHRAAEIRAVSEESGLEWICREPRKITDGSKKNWVGYSKFIAPDGKNLPSGKYVFFYEDASGRECESFFSLNIRDEYFTSKSSDYPDLIKQSKSKKLAVYDESNSLVYYGDYKKAWKTESDALKDYPDAICYRICYATADSKNCFVMPFVYFEESKNEESKNSSESQK